MRTSKILILLNCAVALLPAQTVINGGRTIMGAWDASQSAASKPAKMGVALPAACGTGEFFYLTPATAGKNLYLCTSADTWTQIAATGTAQSTGGGAAATGGLMASAPACGTATNGTLFFGDDSPYETWCNGTAWKYRFDGAPVTPADDSTFSWINQGTATSSVSGGMSASTGVVGITAPGGGSYFNPRIRAVPLSVAAFTVTGVIAPNSLSTFGNNQGAVGLVAYNGSHFVTCEFRITNVPASALVRTGIYTSVFPPYLITYSPTSVQWFPGSPVWLRLQTPDSATFVAMISTDHGANWQTAGTIVFNRPETFTNLGWFVSSDSSDKPISGSLLSWTVSTP